MDLQHALTAFAAVLPAELPDKTALASIVLVARHRRPLAVWAGAAAAFSVHVTLAVTAGRLLGLLPDVPVRVATAALFAVGAVVLLRAGVDDVDVEGAAPGASTWWRAAAASAAVVLVAEWGDLTQLATASLAARSDDPVAVGLGALAALWLVAGLAALLGRELLVRVPQRLLHRTAAAVLTALALWTVVELVA